MTSVVVRTLPVEATHSSLDLFERPSMLVNFDNAIEHQHLPITANNAPTLEFNIVGEKRTYIDLDKIYLELAVKFNKGDGNPQTWVAGSPNDPEQSDKCSFVNNLLHSLFKECEVYANTVKISSTNGLYAHKAYVETEMSYTQDAKDTLLKCHGYTYEDTPQTITSEAFTDRSASSRSSNVIYLFGKVAVDFFNNKKLLLPHVDLRVKLVRSSNDFVTISDTDAKSYQVEIQSAQLHVVKNIVKEQCATAIEQALTESPALYAYTEIVPKTFVMTGGITTWKKEDVFMQEPIKRFALCMNTSAAFGGNKRQNPYNFQKLDLREIRITRNGLPICGTPLSTTNLTKAYFLTHRSLAFGNSGHGISLSDYPNHFILVFDLTATLEASHDYFDNDSGERSINIELYFNTGLTEATELFLIGEKNSIVYIDSKRNVTKNTLFNG